MPGPTPRTAIVAAIGVCVLLTFWFNLGRIQQTELGSKLGSVSIPSLHTGSQVSTTTTISHLPAPAALYFDQVFAEEPKPYDFPALALQCDRTSWEGKENVYLQCENLFAGELRRCSGAASQKVTLCDFFWGARIGGVL